MKLWFNRESAMRVTASALLSAFLFALALSSAPQLHAALHKDSNSANHECAVTLIGSGSYEHSAAPTVFVAPQPLPHVVAVSTVRSNWVARIFLEASIFEHAPPVVS